MTGELLIELFTAFGSLFVLMQYLNIVERSFVLNGPQAFYRRNACGVMLLTCFFIIVICIGNIVNRSGDMLTLPLVLLTIAESLFTVYIERRASKR